MLSRSRSLSRFSCRSLPHAYTLTHTHTLSLSLSVHVVLLDLPLPLSLRINTVGNDTAIRDATRSNATGIHDATTGSNATGIHDASAPRVPAPSNTRPRNGRQRDGKPSPDAQVSSVYTGI